MARTTLTRSTAPGSYGAAGAAVTFTAADVANKNQFTATGRELVIARNSGASAYTITITSAPDPYGRTGHITAESIAAGETKVFGPFKRSGWQQTDGFFYLEASNAAVLFGIVVLPE